MYLKLSSQLNYCDSNTLFHEKMEDTDVSLGTPSYPARHKCSNCEGQGHTLVQQREGH